LFNFQGRTKRDNTSTSSKIRAEESEEKEEKTVPETVQETVPEMAQEMVPEEEEAEEDKEDLKEKPQSNKLPLNNQPPPKLEHVLCEYYLTSFLFTLK
jgi:hypothetical protein